MTKARRVNGRSDLREMTVKPLGSDAVEIELPITTSCTAAGAVCTSDGRKLSNANADTVAGPPGLSVADARVEEADGAVLAFVVALTRAARAAVSVDYATANGSATAGEDYTAKNGTLSIGAGSTTGTIEIMVAEDEHNEGEETLTLELSNASGSGHHRRDGHGTIENHDPLPAALLARFGRAAAVHIVDDIEQRISAPRAAGFSGRFAGREIRKGMGRNIALEMLGGLTAGAGPHTGTPGAIPNAAGMHGPPLNGPRSGHNALGHALAPRSAGTAMPRTPGASPAMPPQGGETGATNPIAHAAGFGYQDPWTGTEMTLSREHAGGVMSFWSRNARSHFAGQEGTVALSGDVRTNLFGADYSRGRIMTGVSVARSHGTGGYAGATAGEVLSAVTGVYPWLGYKATERITVWGTGGYGTGGMMLTPQDGTPLQSGLSMAMAAAGTRGELRDGAAGGFDLAFKADALWVGTSTDGVDGPAGRLKATRAAVTRFRTGIEAGRSYATGTRFGIKPTVELGLRHDGGDAENGSGMDIGAGLVVSDAGSGLSVDLRIRTLLVHEAEGFSERGVTLAISYNPTPTTPLGFNARVTPAWGGQATGGAEALWGRDTMGGMAHGATARATGWTAKWATASRSAPASSARPESA